MNRIAWLPGLIVSAVLAATACGGPDDGNLGGEIRGTEESAHDLGLSTSALAKMETPDPQGAVSATIAAPDSHGCRTRVKDPLLPNVVHVFLDNCTGRFGRHTVSGEVVITFSKKESGSLHAEHRSVGLTIDGRAATTTASADITFDSDLRHVGWHGEKVTTSEKGEQVNRVAEHTIEVNRTTGCSVFNGTAKVTRGDRVIDAVLTEMTSCEGTDGSRDCPTGLIEATVEGRNVEITKTFDGTATAVIEVTRRKGSKTREVLLDCVPLGS